ncbi:hypothetical protein BD847_0241 [Flavobacterium cutihirudinis]|uniref:Uncharacterized protein n=1 Tax=Flavobacterium cutihirudinis TaxID=1265740 RepID=A0A3D9FZF8_9FLAO|nr:hypothetical protein [Flavobacterium cutihirudinis]RED26324.1 hypothetical protein BD847_0241 [Flavobacterium cutihirudinis]
MKKILIFCSISIALVSCTPESQNKNLTYQNIVIISDMSSRLDNKPSKDIDEIHKIIIFFKNECVKPGEKIGDKSSISFSPFSQKTITAIDLEKYKNLAEKQSFINSTGKYKNNGLAKQIEDFESKVKIAYATTRNKGLDLISILIEKIENEAIIKNDTSFVNGIDTTFIKYDNHIYVFTDGYLEYLNKKGNSQFYFSNSEIEKVRQFSKSNNIDISKALEMESSLGLPTEKSNKNKQINLHILETHERDKNNQLQSYKYPKGLRDNEILQAVWKKWTLDSGFKSFEWKKY